MRMKLRCKNCGRMFYFHDRLVKAVVAFMEARQTMYKILWNKDFNSIPIAEMGVTKIVSLNAGCCQTPHVQMLEFHGYE